MIRNLLASFALASVLSGSAYAQMVVSYQQGVTTFEGQLLNQAGDPTPIDSNSVIFYAYVPGSWDFKLFERKIDGTILKKAFFPLVTANGNIGYAGRWSANGAGDVVFAGAPSGSYQADGIYRLTPDGQVSKIMTMSPQSFYLNGLSANKDGSVTLIGFDSSHVSGIYKLSAGGTDPQLVLAGNAMFAGVQLQYIQSAASNNNGDMVFKAGHTTVDGRQYADGIFKLSADGSQHIVETIPSGFNADKPGITDAGLVYYMLSGVDAATGQYMSKLVNDDESRAPAVVLTPGQTYAGVFVNYIAGASVNGAGSLSVAAANSSWQPLHLFSPVVKTVVVLTPAELIGQLAGAVVTLNLKSGIASSLDAKLDAALQAIDAENVKDRASAVNKLEAFKNETRAQSGKAIPVDAANALISLADKIIASLTK